MSANARQVGGTHYKDMPIQPWDVMQHILAPDEFAGFLKGNYIKYSMRAAHKAASGDQVGADLDAEKAEHYRQKLLEWQMGPTTPPQGEQQ